MLHILNQMLSNGFIFEGDEAEAAGLSSIDILKNNSTLNWSKLLEMLSQFIIVEFKIKSTDKYFRLGILENNLFVILFLIAIFARSSCNIGLFLLHDDVGIRLRNIRHCIWLISHWLHGLVRLHVLWLGTWHLVDGFT